MSNILIRNIVGTGPFQIPTTPTAIESLDSAINTIVSAIPHLTYKNAKGQVLSNIGAPDELLATIESITYNGVIVPPTSALRAAIQTAFTSNPNITSVGSIEIRILPEGAFYNIYPQVESLDAANAIVCFSSTTPPGAQIEAYKYSKHYAGEHHGSFANYSDRLGKRYRPDRLMAKGQLEIDLSAAVRVRRRSHFRFAYRWPPPLNLPGVPGVGVRGPLGPLTISTTTPWERSQGTFLLINPSPSGMGHH